MKLFSHSLLLLLLIFIPIQYGHSADMQAKKMLVIGDSLSAAYGFELKNGWVNLLRKRFNKKGINILITNASISGDTSQSAKQRLADYLATESFDYLILEIGGNDGLRGLPLKSFSKNMQQMIDLAKKQSLKTLLLGVNIPHNYGPIYKQGFDNTYVDLSNKNNIALVPFFLKNIAEDLDKMQADGIHPKEEYQQQILDNIWGEVLKLLG